MMKLFVVAVVFFGLHYQVANASSETVKIYPISDGVNFLYDDENQTIWSEARNYQGTLSNVTNVAGENVAARSDTHSGKYRIYRASLAFDTSVIPDDASIETSRLNLFKEAEGNNRGDTQLVITEHTRQMPSVLNKEDWYLQNYGIEFSRILLLDEQYTIVDLGDSFSNYINMRGITVIGGMTSYDFDNIDPGFVISSASFYSNEKLETLKRPYLEVTYTVPDKMQDIERLITELKLIVKSEIARKPIRASYRAQIRVLEKLIKNENIKVALAYSKVIERQIKQDSKKDYISSETASKMQEVLSAIRESLKS
jgi:hypothetical protein